MPPFLSFRRSTGCGAVLMGVALVTACTGTIDEVPSDMRPPALDDLPGGPVAIPGTCTEVNAASTEMRRLSSLQYRRSIDIIFDGQVAPSQRYPALGAALETGYSTEDGFDDIGEQAVEEIVYAAEDVALAAFEVIGELLPCSLTSTDRSCAESFVDVYATRAYRRPPDLAERDALLAQFDAAVADGATFDESVALLVVHLLQSPQFLYAVEDAAPSRRALSGFEVATRLAFMLTDASPDDALLDAAQSGSLSSPEGALAEAERLLSSNGADTAMARFLREWTGTEEVSAADKSDMYFPNFDAALASSMNESFDRFARAVVREGSLGELMRSPDVFVDPVLAAFFDIPAPSDGWARVSLDPLRYSGILTQPAWLASLAHSDRASYVFRGRNLRTRLLCEELGAPPPNATSEEAEIVAALPPDPTARDHSLAVRRNSACAACHDRIDPAGLAFERFDAIGQYHETDESGRIIDSSGTLIGRGEGEMAFADHVELIEGLSEDAAFTECFARQIFRFSLSRREREADACAIAEIRDALNESGEVRDALFALVTSDAFRFRTEETQ